MINGITYFRLKPKYEGDIVKNAGLEGCDIDKNFRFLEDKIVDKLTVSDDGMDLIITFRDGTTVTGEDVLASNLNYEFDKENGVLNIRYNNGEICDTIDGLVSIEMLEKYLDDDYSISTDNTLVGDGRNINPLAIHPMYRNGMYRAVDRLIDTGMHEEIPTEGLYPGDRFLVSENYSTYGVLYNYDGVMQIMEMLAGENSPWRVPSKEDWDDMLNALEPVVENRNHNSTESNVMLGNMAGMRLRQNGSWHLVGVEGSSEECLQTFGFDALPSGYANDARILSFFSNTTKSPYDGEYMERTTFWTTRSFERNVAYIKSIGNRSNGVYQDIANGNEFFSIRLVKDYNGVNFNEVENILGETYTTTLMPSESGHQKIWTNVNISIVTGLNDRLYFLPTEYDAEGNTRYFIWEWTGNRWMRNEMLRGESVYIDQINNYSYAEITPTTTDVSEIEWECYATEEEILPYANATSAEYVAVGNCEFEYEPISEEISDAEEVDEIPTTDITYDSPKYIKKMNTSGGICHYDYYEKVLTEADKYFKKTITESFENGIYLLKKVKVDDDYILQLVCISGSNTTYSDFPPSFFDEPND